MSQEILMNMTPTECRIAVVENGVLQEFMLERTAKRGLVGNIYLGKVVRVLPGMQAAFVDVGLTRTAFLHLNDMVLPQKTPETNIAEVLHAGQMVSVQVIKDMLGSKGARLTNDLSIPSRYLVYMPFGQYVGISQKIEDEAERERLKTACEALLAQYELSGSFIIRTAAEGVDVAHLQQDVEYLSRLWKIINKRQKGSQEVGLIFAELPLTERIVRDVAGEHTDKILIDSRETYTKVVEFAQNFVPQVKDRIVHYPGPRPIFDLYNIEEDLQKALQIRVDLKSGGYLIMDQTEAMTTIDVNTGSLVSGRSLEDIVYKTNLEATISIARQLRLRNLGGIIIIDFIDMVEPSHKEEVMQSLQRELQKDHAKTKITQVSELGLIEMTRKRTSESLEHLLCEPCPTCQGRGFVKTAETVCYEILREVLRYARAYEAPKGYTVVAHQSVIDRLLSTDAPAVADLEHFINKVIKFQVDSLYTQEQYEIILA